jgi:aminoglycoside/choline kinase family phosphotransferase
MSLTKLELLNHLFDQWCGEPAVSINKLPASGSPREYYRITGTGSVAIGAINHDREENEAFIEFSRHFRKLGLAVPEIYLVDLDRNIYLQEDLGDLSLFDHLVSVRDNGNFPEDLTAVYRTVLTELQKFQITGAEGLDYGKCYPRSSFDRQSMQWDLSYFKYYFLKLAGIPFNEQKLEDDYNTLIDYLLAQDTDHFLCSMTWLPCYTIPRQTSLLPQGRNCWNIISAYWRPIRMWIPGLSGIPTTLMY